MHTHVRTHTHDMDAYTHVHTRANTVEQKCDWIRVRP